MASIDTRSLSDDVLETLRFRAVAMHEAAVDNGIVGLGGHGLSISGQ